MPDTSFPTLTQLHRSESILETVSGEDEGLILMSGESNSGVTTTLTALAHELVRKNKKVLHVRFEDSGVLPGIDAIVSASLNSKLVNYLFSLQDNAYDAIIFDEKETSAELFHLAARLAHRRTHVIISLEAESNDRAVEKFGAAFAYNEQLKRKIEKSIILSVHHFMFNLDSEASPREKLRKPALETSREMFKEVNPEKNYLPPNRFQRLLVNPYPYPKRL